MIIQCDYDRCMIDFILGKLSLGWGRGGGLLQEDRGGISQSSICVDLFIS